MGVTCGILLVIFELQDSTRSEVKAPSAIDG
jgi:hypothetical protein